MSELGKGFHAGFAASVIDLDGSNPQLVHLKFEYFLRRKDNRGMSLSFRGLGSAAPSVLAGLLLAGCTSSEPPKAPKPAPEPPKAITGRSAFYKVFPAARLLRDGGL